MCLAYVPSNCATVLHCILCNQCKMWGHAVGYPAERTELHPRRPPTSKKCIADVTSSSRDALQVLLSGVLIPDSKPPWESLQQQIVWVERYALGQFGLCWGFMCVLFSWVFVFGFLSLENNDLRHQVLLWSKCGGTSIRTTGFPG